MAKLFIPIPTQAATGDITSSSQELGESNSFQNASLQYVATGLNTADATVKLQGCNDNQAGAGNWMDITDSTVTLASGSSAAYLIIANVAMKYYRVVFSKGTNSAGTINVLINFN